MIGWRRELCCRAYTIIYCWIIEDIIIISSLLLYEYIGGNYLPLYFQQNGPIIIILQLVRYSQKKTQFMKWNDGSIHTVAIKLTTVRVISRIIVDENHVFITNLKQKKNIKLWINNVSEK